MLKRTTPLAISPSVAAALLLWWFHIICVGGNWHYPPSSLNMLYQGEVNDQFIVKVADKLEEAIKLMEVGFEYHAEIEGHKLFRKRKW